MTPLVEFALRMGREKKQRHPENDSGAVIAGPTKRVPLDHMLADGIHVKDALPVRGSRRIQFELNPVVKKVIAEGRQDLELTQKAIHLGRAFFAKGDVAAPEKGACRIGADAREKGKGHPLREASFLAKHMFDHGFSLPVYDHELADVGVVVERVVDQHARGFVTHDRTA